MMKAQFLGFSPDAGDAFTYIIATKPDSDPDPVQIYTRSFIWPRHVREEPPVVIRHGQRKFEIYKRDERTILEASNDSDFPPSLSLRAHNLLPAIPEEPVPLDSVVEYKRGIEEVYGPPPSKRLCIDPDSEALVRTDPEEIQPFFSTMPSPASEPQETTPVIQPIVQNEQVTTTATARPRPPVQGPVPVTQQDEDDAVPTAVAEDSDDESIHPTDHPDSDADSVHSADGFLDKDEVNPESVDTHIYNNAGITDYEDFFDLIHVHEFGDGVLFLQVK